MATASRAAPPASNENRLLRGKTLPCLVVSRSFRVMESLSLVLNWSNDLKRNRLLPSAKPKLGRTLSISPSEVNPRNEVALRSLLTSSRSGAGSKRSATKLVAEQAPGALHVIAEERGSDGKEPDGAVVELETPDVADAMSEQLRLHSILFFREC